MTDAPHSYGSRLDYTDGTSLTVETLDGLVRLVTRSVKGEIKSGILLAPDEAQRLGQTLLEAAFGVRAHE